MRGAVKHSTTHSLTHTHMTDTTLASLLAAKQDATALLQAGHLSQARDAFFSVLIAIDSDETRTPDPNKLEIKIACLNNLMVLFLKTKKYKEVVELSRQVLKIEPNNVKALFRQGQAFSEIEMNSDALLSLQKLLTIEPNNSQAKELLYKVMDKLNPLEEDDVDNLPVPPSTADKLSTRRPDQGKVYKVARMPNAKSSNESEDKAVKDPTTKGFGSGWDFMNPQWNPDASNVETTSENASQISPSVGESKASDTDNSAQIFLDEAERARIKNQLFADALKSSTSATSAQTTKDKSKVKSSSRQKEVVVDELVSKTVEELSIEEKKLVAKVESKKAKSTKTKVSKSKKSTGDSVLKNKTVSAKAKT